ncbi:potassium channel family protein [Paenibacillus sp. y28]|uniref:potassium channel family protein n=1 Tax=Paenibacillus sp. y28 TaxID=3129110 RepID=UPI003018F13E
MKKKTFVVIGMGRFGSSVAYSLCNQGYEVLAIDSSEQRVQEVAHTVTHAVQADSTDEEALRALGVRNFDVVVVAIGEDIQASILTSIVLKEIGVPFLVVKAQTDLHGKVLAKIGVNKVVFPERDMGNRVATHLVSPNILDYIELSDDYSIVEMLAAPSMVGKNLRQLDVRAKFGCNVMAIKTGSRMNIAPQATDLIQEGDMLVVVGKKNQLQQLQRALGE